MEFNLLPYRDEVRARELFRAKFLITAAVVSAVLLGLCVDMLVRFRLERLQKDVQQLQKQLQDGMRQDALPADKNNAGSLMSVLHEINQYGVCITSIAKDAGQVVIEGSANQAQGVLDLLKVREHDKAFPDFKVETLQRSRHDNLFQFKISASY